MSDASTLLEELRQIRAHLMTPTQQAVQQCERKSVGLLARIEASGLHLRNATEVKVLSGQIQRLLASARDFWDRRQSIGNPGQQYGSRGSMILPITDSTFAIEV